MEKSDVQSLQWQPDSARDESRDRGFLSSKIEGLRFLGGSLRFKAECFNWIKERRRVLPSPSAISTAEHMMSGYLAFLALGHHTQHLFPYTFCQAPVI